MLQRTLIVSAIVLMLGVSALHQVTNGFTVMTTEQARRQEMQRLRPQLPEVQLLDQDGREFGLGSWVKQGGRILIVDFIYTRCTSLCLTLGTDFQRLQDAIVERGLQGRVRLLSISFDPERDEPETLRHYAERLSFRPDIWTFATVHRTEDLEGILRFFGVTVIPDGLGGFQHNAALIWISPDGRIERITDVDVTKAYDSLDHLGGRDVATAGKT